MSVRLPLLAAASCGISLLALAGCGTEPVAAGSGPATTAPTATVSAEPTATTETTATTKTSATGGCPVSAATLQTALRMPDGWRIDETSIECADRWAQAGLIAPAPESQGDGVMLFRFDTSVGRWAEMEQGSSIDCADRGIPRAAAGELSVCNRAY